MCALTHSSHLSERACSCGVRSLLGTPPSPSSSPPPPPLESSFVPNTCPESPSGCDSSLWKHYKIVNWGGYCSIYHSAAASTPELPVTDKAFSLNVESERKKEFHKYIYIYTIRILVSLSIDLVSGYARI